MFKRAKGLSLKQIIVFSKEMDTNERIQVFKNVDDFLESKIEPMGFFIDISLKEEAKSIAKTIRHSLFWYLYIVSSWKTDSLLIDQHATLREAIQKFESMQEILEKLQIDPLTMKQEEKLLLYLYLREDVSIVPFFNKEHKQLYSYPLAECFSNKVDDHEWIYELFYKNLLESKQLVDRVRLCMKCQSAHLYFLDKCPSCSSIKIKKSTIIHCFACGYVDEERAFESKDGFVCPKCHSHLKLIGVDYDMPTTQYKCFECLSIFEEPKIVAKCMDCFNENEPSKLLIKEFFTFGISFLGKEFLLSDRKKALFSLFEESLRHIKYEEFLLFLDWVAALHERDQSFEFVVVVLHFTNIKELIEYYGFTQLSSMMQTFSKRVLELLRETDILSMDRDYNVWMLLPSTKKRGIENRLNEAISMMQPQKDVAFKIELKSFYSVESKIAPKDLSADYIVELLQKD